ncbi:DNA polymerase III subunit delta [bacterium]|nr:MAG: DNA polymerase III subunit delta [bacterium]
MAPEKAIALRTVLIVGDEELLRRRALEGVLAAAGVDKDDFDLEAFEGDETDPETWLAAAGTAPFLAEKRTVVVRHLLRCDPEKLREGALAGLPETGLLVLVADEESGDNADRRAKAWTKAVGKAKGAVIECNADPKKAAEAIRPELARLGKTMSPQAAATLLEMTGGSLSRATDELEKLSLYVGDAERIDEAAVRAVVVPSREWNVFSMIDAILEANVPEALRNLRILVGSAAKAADVAHASIIPLTSRALRLAWQARVCLDAGRNPGDAGPEIRATFPDKPNLAKEPPYRQSRVMASARKTTLPALAACLGVLADTDSRLKGALPNYTPIDTLERMVLEMVEALRKR